MNKEHGYEIILITGFIVTILLTIHAYTVLERANEVKLLVDKRTKELKTANEELDEEKELLQSVIDNTSAVIYLKDTTGHYIIINKQYENLFHVTKEDVIGRTDYEIFPKELAEPFCANDKKVIEAGHTLEFEEYAPHDDGLHAYISVKSPVHDSEGNINGVYGISTDITYRKRMTEEREKLQRLELIGILSGGIAHDFNNLLAAILGNVSLAKIYSKPGDKIFDKLIIAEDVCMQAKELSHRLLTFSKGGVLSKEETAIQEILKETIASSLDGSNISCEFIFPDNLFHVEIDREQMKQVIKNIALNAREAMPEGGIVKVYAENVTVGESNTLNLAKGNYMKISINDNGKGIAMENIPKIFDPYFTTKPMGSVKGMGLGLAVVYSIVKKHNGLVAVDSKVGTGTTFHIYLPVS